MAHATEVRQTSLMKTPTPMRGVVRVGFSTECDAQGQSCDYRASWEVKEFIVEYTVTARQVENGRTEWITIGFSDDRWMVGNRPLWLMISHCDLCGQ